LSQGKLPESDVSGDSVNKSRTVKSSTVKGEKSLTRTTSKDDAELWTPFQLMGNRLFLGLGRRNQSKHWVV
jgi:hypothetical protein